MFNENERAVLGQMDENGFIKMELRFQWVPEHDVEIKKCGFRLVYEQDIEDIREMISAQSSNSTCVTLYEDVHHKSTEGIKLKRSRNEYEGLGASGEGSSNDVPHSKRIEKIENVWAHSNSVHKDSNEGVLGLVSHLYKDSVAYYWACGNLFFFFSSSFLFKEIGHDTKESSLSITLFTRHL